VRWLFLLLGLEFPAILSLVDCYNRTPDHFAGGEADRRSWIRWLWVGALTAWALIGNGVILGYYYSVVRRNSMTRP
jgi:hypothetical protein